MKKTYKCPECKKFFAFGFLEMVGNDYICPHCSWQGPNPKEVVSDNPVIIIASDRENEKLQKGEIGIKKTIVDVENPSITYVRFPAVKALSSIISVLAWILFAVSMIMGLMAFSNGGFFTGIPIVVGGVLILIVNLAIAQLLLLFLAIEENTRKS